MNGSRLETGHMDAETRSAPTVQAREAWRSQLHRANLRVTKQRLAVLEAIEHHPHTVAEDIHGSVRTALPEITVQSIYTIINALLAAGVIRKLDLPNSPARYELEEHDNHHHVVCRCCGRIENVSCAVGEAPCLQPQAHHGMTIQIAEVIYQGVCQDCASAA